MGENWKPIVGYEDYSISNLGHIIGKRGKILKPMKCRSGYLFVGLYKNNKRKVTKIHNRVAETFLGITPKGLEINHRDANKENNSVENLEFVTRGQNMRHAVKIGALVAAKGSKCGASKLTEDQVIEIRERHACGDISFQRLANEYGVSRAMVGYIVRRKWWTHV